MNEWKILSDTELFFYFYNIALTHMFRNGKVETPEMLNNSSRKSDIGQTMKGVVKDLGLY